MRRDQAMAPAARRVGPGKVKAFILLRFTLIIAASYLLLEETGLRSVPTVIFALIAFGLVSNVVVFKLPVRWIESVWFSAGVVIVDTSWITVGLLVTGRFEPEFFYLYFFVLFVAAIGENLRLIALGAVVICGGYLYGLVEAHGVAALASSSSLIRIPFLFAVATFYGYLVDRVRSEQRRAEKEAATVADLESTQRILAHHAREVEEARDELEHEVEERRRAEEELRKLTRAVEQSPSMVAITDTSGVIEYANPRFANAIGRSAEEAIGLAVGELESGGRQEDAWQVLRSRGEWEGEVLVTPTGGGERFWAATSISHLVDEEGGADHCIVVQQDISDRKRAEEALRQANEELTKLSEMKSDFVSTVSHELRTPLTAIKNSIDLLERGGNLDEKAQENFFAIASRNVDRLRLIIDDLLDLSKLEAGKLEFRFRSVEPGPLLKEIFSSFESRAEAQGPDLELRVMANLDEVWIDAHRIEQVVGNLLSNAIKFTPAGGRVLLEAKRHSEGVEISVSDTGFGIAPGDQERIFERFYQVGNSLTRKVRGTGLGLSIARDFLRTHGSELRVESELGKGSRFWFVLPRFSARTAEMAALELEIWQQRIYPFFGLLVIELRRGRNFEGKEDTEARLLALQKKLLEKLPRRSDIFCLQPAQGRLVLILTGTPKEGCEVVRHKVASVLEAGEAVSGARVFGPASYPDDGSSARELVACALDRQTTN